MISGTAEQWIGASAAESEALSPWRVPAACAAMTDLRASLEKYEVDAVACEEIARLAVHDQPKRDLFERLARHYRELATDFRKALEAKQAA
jgi:hypothetical protein